jgi:hypothetical protein
MRVFRARRKRYFHAEASSKARSTDYLNVPTTRIGVHVFDAVLSTWSQPKGHGVTANDFVTPAPTSDAVYVADVTHGTVPDPIDVVIILTVNEVQGDGTTSCTVPLEKPCTSTTGPAIGVAAARSVRSTETPWRRGADVESGSAVGVFVGVAVGVFGVCANAPDAPPSQTNTSTHANFFI